jgi:hypothetical protein
MLKLRIGSYHITRRVGKVSFVSDESTLRAGEEVAGQRMVKKGDR